VAVSRRKGSLERSFLTESLKNNSLQNFLKDNSHQHFFSKGNFFAKKLAGKNDIFEQFDQILKKRLFLKNTG
jgi:hypothetical protein